MSVHTKLDGTHFYVVCNFNTRFVESAKRLGGRWVEAKFDEASPSKKCWRFDVREEELVKKLLIKIYGEDGVSRPQLTTLRIDWPVEESSKKGKGCDEGYDTSLEVLGRRIAHTHFRDQIRIAPGIVRVKGALYSRNWRTCVAEGTVVLVRDFPLQSASRLVASNSHPQRDYSINLEEVLQDAASAVRATAVESDDALAQLPDHLVTDVTSLR